jgi:hypothetical protein
MQAPTATIQLIQSIIAPALMISGCGLIQLSLFNRYSIMQARLRNLNDERRKLYAATQGEIDFSKPEFSRLSSLELQISSLLHRTKLIHDAIIYVIVGIMFFVLSSLAIAAVLFVPDLMYALAPLLIFIMGMGSVLIGIFLTAREIKMSFDNIWLEVNSVVK